MAPGDFRSLPLSAGPIDPTRLINAHYEFLQTSLVTVDDQYTTCFADTVDENGIILYEVRIVGKGAVSDFMSVKRTFTVFRNNSQLELLDVSSDYTKKTDPEWGVSAAIASGDIIIQVKGSAQQVNWAAQVTKTIHHI